MPKVDTAAPKITSEKSNYYYGTGSRKTAIARVRLYPGKGDAVINNNKIEKPDQVYIAALELVGLKNKFDISVNVRGGGAESQKEAIRHGISRALVKYKSELKSTLRKAGYLTRDSRVKERKKPGLKRARRAPQWQKR
jgi:small subunit ribosomal protein S9